MPASANPRSPNVEGSGTAEAATIGVCRRVNLFRPLGFASKRSSGTSTAKVNTAGRKRGTFPSLQPRVFISSTVSVNIGDWAVE